MLENLFYYLSEITRLNNVFIAAEIVVGNASGFSRLRHLLVPINARFPYHLSHLYEGDNHRCPNEAENEQR